MSRLQTSPPWLCGTPEYLAPDVILGHGHGAGVDWWALGILLHEMCAWVAPFTSHREAGEDRQLQIYEQIISTKLTCPDYFSLELVDLVTRLLSRYKENRLGIVGSVREHCWFRETDWSIVMLRKMEAPYVPGDRSQDWIKEDEEYCEAEKTSDLDQDTFEDF